MDLLESLIEDAQYNIVTVMAIQQYNYETTIDRRETRRISSSTSKKRPRKPQFALNHGSRTESQVLDTNIISDTKYERK